MANLPILFRIQEIESRLQALKREADQAYGNPDLLAVDSQLKEINRLLIKSRNHLKATRNSQKQMNMELESCQERLKVEEEKLYSGTTSSSKELGLIQQKAAEYVKSKAKIEDDIIKLLEEDENFTGKIRDLEKSLTVFEQQKSLIGRQIEQRLLIISDEVKELQTELSAVEDQVPVQWLERYRRIAKSHNGVGIAKMKSDNCGGCHVGLSDSLFLKVKRGEDALFFCENCGRILYF
jgi:uncharacterized protein